MLPADNDDNDDLDDRDDSMKPSDFLKQDESDNNIISLNNSISILVQ
jgi:hypothetical protein